MNFEAIKKAVVIENQYGRYVNVTLAEVVVSTYWNDYKLNLMSLYKLDCANFKHAIDVISYRKTLYWDDNKFWDLAKFCRNALEK